jgi:hypothetical protein
MSYTQDTSISIDRQEEKANQIVNDIFTKYDVENIKPEMGDDGRYHYIYLTQNLITKKFYIGKHTHVNYENSYIGSGNRIRKDICPFNLAIEKYGKENFKKTILKFFKDSNLAFQEEAILLSTDFIQKYGSVADSFKICYNIKVGGLGGMSGFIQSEETRKKRSISQKKAFATDEHKLKRSNASKRSWEDIESRELKKKRIKEALARPESKERQRQASKKSSARPEVKEKLRRRNFIAKANKPMIDLEGNTILVHKDNMLEKLYLGWRLKTRTILLTHSIHKDEKTLVLKEKGLDIEKQHKTLIRLLENGYIIGGEGISDGKEESKKRSSGNKGLVSIIKEGQCLKVHESEVKEYLKDGWEKGLKSQYVLVDLEGREHLILKCNVLSRLKERYWFKQTSIRICNKEKVRVINFEKKEYKVDKEKLRQKLIGLLESGEWQLGCVWEELGGEEKEETEPEKEEPVEKVMERKREYCKKRGMESLF